MQPSTDADFDDFSPRTEELFPDRRSDIRFVTVSRPIMVEHDGEQSLGRCRDISDNGAKLELHQALERDSRVTIAFSPADIVKARVVWIDGPVHGVIFDEPIDCLRILRQRAWSNGSLQPRPARRRPARIVRSGGANHGMGVARVGTFEPGLRVRVILAGGRECDGLIRWSRDSAAAGVMLFDPFSEEGGPVKRLSYGA